MVEELPAHHLARVARRDAPQQRLGLQAPEPAGPVQIKLTEVKGDMKGEMERPWVRYEFVDPQLESLSAGQKMLVRMGPVNERRLKAKLTEFRRQVATGALAKK